MCSLLSYRKLQEGDEIVSVNGSPINGRTPSDLKVHVVCSLLHDVYIYTYIESSRERERERDRQIDKLHTRQIDTLHAHTHTHVQVHVVGPSGTTVSLGVRKKSSGLVSEIKLTRGPTPPEHKALLHQKPHLSPVHTRTHTHIYMYTYTYTYTYTYIFIHTQNYTSGIALVYAPVTISPCTAELQW
jgi:hypothetical protein